MCTEEIWSCRRFTETRVCVGARRCVCVWRLQEVCCCRCRCVATSEHGERCFRTSASWTFTYGLQNIPEDRLLLPGEPPNTPALRCFEEIWLPWLGEQAFVLPPRGALALCWSAGPSSVVQAAPEALQTFIFLITTTRSDFNDGEGSRSSARLCTCVNGAIKVNVRPVCVFMGCCGCI